MYASVRVCVCVCDFTGLNVIWFYSIENGCLTFSTKANFFDGINKNNELKNVKRKTVVDYRSSGAGTWAKLNEATDE